MEVTARINTDSPTGRKLVREIQKHKKVAKVDYPLPEAMLNGTSLSEDEVWDEVWQILSDHYGVDVRNL
jgi:endonuclease/exonuclease/phosphatase family metal-dependent hydrolase